MESMGFNIKEDLVPVEPKDAFGLRQETDFNRDNP